MCQRPQGRGLYACAMTAVNKPNPTPTPMPESTESTESTKSDSATPQPPATASAPAKQRHNPLHGVTLETMVVALADYFGWDELGQRIPVRCFQSDPSVKSSLKFLRKTPWAREKVESLYLFVLRDQKRNAQE